MTRWKSGHNRLPATGTGNLLLPSLVATVSRHVAIRTWSGNPLASFHSSLPAEAVVLDHRRARLLDSGGRLGGDVPTGEGPRGGSGGHVDGWGWPSTPASRSRGWHAVHRAGKEGRLKGVTGRTREKAGGGRGDGRWPTPSPGRSGPAVTASGSLPAPPGSARHRRGERVAIPPEGARAPSTSPHSRLPLLSSKSGTCPP